MENPNKEMIDKIENYMIDPEKAVFEAILEFKESLDKINIDKIESLQGIDGITPVKGVDYMTEKEAKDLEHFILDRLPTKGVDYPNLVQVKAEIKKQVSKIKTIKGDKGDSVKGKDGKQGKDGNDGSPDTPIEIVKKIQTIKEDKKKLQIKDINGLKDRLKKNELNENDIDSLRKEIGAIRVTLPTGFGGGATKFSELSDVSIADVLADQSVKWNGTSWIPYTPTDLDEQTLQSVTNFGASTSVQSTFSSGLLSGLGTVSLPSYSFAGDMDTGMWSPTADTLALSTAGVERMRVNSSGNVGIGTTNPQARLDVSGVYRNVGLPFASFTFPTTGVGFEMRYQTDYDAITLDNTGGSGSGSSVFQSYDRGGTAWKDMILRGKNIRLNAQSGGSILFGGGNVGIGTTAPGAKLHVSETSGRVAIFGNIAASSLTANPVNVSFGSTYGSNTPGSTGNLKWDLFTSSSTGLRYGIGMSANLMEFQAGPAGQHAFFVNNGTEALRILANGNVGIGTTAPSARLHTISTTEQLRVGYSAAIYWNATTAITTGITTFDAVGGTTPRFVFSDRVFLASIGAGATQAGAGAVANEIWKTLGHATLPNNVLMIGV